MKYTMEAYDVLVHKLKHDVSKLEATIDENNGTSSTIICGLLDYIVDKLGIGAAVIIAEKFDKKFPQEELVRYLQEKN